VLAVKADDAQAGKLRVQIERVQASGTESRRDPQATLRRCQVGRGLVGKKRFRAAIVYLEMAAWLDERAPLPQHYLANAYYLAGERGRAIEHERRAAALAPQNELYRNNLVALEQMGGGGSGAAVSAPTADSVGH
jgi:tetratricopeptide (TPR) repeat protein